MTLRMSADGRAQLIRREGFKTRAYRDSVGVWTIGVGHTSAAGEPRVTPGLTISKAQVDEILSRDLVQYETAVRSAVRVPLTQGQFDALVSLCFNIGVGGFKGSTVVKRLNAGDYKGAADAMLLWNKPKEIIGRRKSERAQFLAATKKAGGDAPKVAAAGKIDAPAPTPGHTDLMISPEAIDEALAANPLPEELANPGENVSADYLRAAGSRIVENATSVKKIATTILGGDLASAAAQSSDALQKAQDAYAGFEHGASLLDLARSYWPLIVGLLLTIIIAYVAWRALRAADRIIAARVEDAAAGLHVGR
jgi:lysozyme